VTASAVRIGAAGKLGDRVYEYILSQIISGAFAVAERLPAESELAERLGVSRPIVREALGRLRDDGLVASRQGSGSYVLRRPAPDVGSYAPISSIADVQRCFVFRIAVEGEIAALAARVREEDGLLRLRHAFNALEIVTEQGRLGVEEDISFHRAVAETTGNHFFVTTLNGLHEQIATGIRVNRNLSLVQPRSRLLSVQVEHRRILEAIESGNEDDARRAMHTHLENARHRVFEGS
jgi:GntR family transcriptional regulator, transcriptional repressor for pyruvate dehydrogenase complex